MGLLHEEKEDMVESVTKNKEKVGSNESKEESDLNNKSKVKARGAESRIITKN